LVIYTGANSIAVGGVSKIAAWQDPVKRENMLKNRKPITDEERQIRSQRATESNKKDGLIQSIRKR